MWYAIATERFGATNPAAARLRFFSGNSGSTLTAQQPLNNVIRSTIQCLGAVLGGAQSIHVMGYDEAFQIPSEEAVRLSLRTQQIIGLETGVSRTADPLAGSYFVEHLTDEIEARAREILAEIDALGGAASALDQGVPQSWITQAAYQAEQDIAEGRRPKVGVNVYASPGEDDPSQLIEPAQPDPALAERQIARTARRLARRDARACERALDRLRDVTRSAQNVMPALVEAAGAGATLGEMARVFRAEFGEFREPAPW
jgi:methylmalonyl-CoA mutase N-terminal domain/subunit